MESRPTPIRDRPAPLRYAVAVLCVAAALLLRWALVPVLGTGFPFIQFFPAVMAAAWFGGLGPGLVATALCAGTATLLLHPYGSPMVARPSDLLGLALFGLTGGLISTLSETLHGARRAAEASARRVEDALQSLRESERANAYLAAIVESSHDAIISQSLDGSITSWNRGAEELFGYSAAEVMGRPITILAPPEQEDEVPRMLERIRRGERIDEYETVRITRDGRRLDVSLIISPVRDASGQVMGISKVARDITERKRLERELRERSEQVQTQNEELLAQSEELQIQNEELEAQDRYRNEFLAMLAHELRNPLAPIVSAAEVLRLRGGEDPSLQRQRSIIERQARHLARLLDDLLDVSRITQGKIQLRKEPVELSALVEQALQICQPLVQERGHALNVSLPPALIRLDADPTRLVQVICNLLNNAAKYTEPGGRIDLSVEVEASQPSTSPIAAIRIRDTGRGISAEELPRIFELFHQAERTADRSEGGLGIGLTLVRSLVHQHGGTVEARSDGLGKGSEFIVRLPALDVRAAVPDLPVAPASSAEGGPADPGSTRVLVIDDNVDAAETLQELVSVWGYDVRAAHGGLQGLRAVEEFGPHIVLLDIGMPGMDGYEVARRVRAEERSAQSKGPGVEGPEADGRDGAPQPVLVALTGYGQEEDRRRAQEAGFDHHLIKPVEPRVLQELLAALAR